TIKVLTPPGWGRFIMLYAKSDMLMPAINAKIKSRRRRNRFFSGTPSGYSGCGLGSQRSPSKISTTVTTSTVNCVRAKSGEDNQAKVKLVTSPAAPDNSKAAGRWNLAKYATPMALAPPTIQSKKKATSNCCQRLGQTH